MSSKPKGRVWIVGVENIHPRFPSGDEIVADVVWHSEHTRRADLTPWRTRRFGRDEMDLYVRFVRDLQEVGYEPASEEAEA